MSDTVHEHEPTQQELPPCHRHPDQLCSGTCQYVTPQGHCLIDDAAFLLVLTADNGYRDPRLIAAATRYACIRPLAFTHAIITGAIGDRFGFERQWCYHTYEEARAALDVWDGQGEPQGWHRDPITGRRVSASADEIDSNGNRVGAIGVIYHRW